MKRKFLQILALAALVAVPAAFVSVPAAAAPAEGSAKTSKKNKSAPRVWAMITFSFEKPMRAEWKINFPDKLIPDGTKESARPEKFSIWGDIKDSPRGPVVVKSDVDAKTGVEAVYEIPLKDVVKIEWTWRKNRDLLQQARNALAQGDPAAALATAERFLKFFNDLKSVEGSLWMEAAVIKLDALDRQENDGLLDSFIREIEYAGGVDKIEGLPKKIKLVRLRQQLRKGEFQMVLKDATEMAKTEDDPQTLAELTMLRGRAEFRLGKYEDALYTFLRVPVFYGNQTEYIPASKLEVARCLLKLDNPDRKAQKLAELAEAYVVEVVTEFPMTPEAKDALELLPKDKQAELAARDALAEDQKRAVVSASIAATVSDDDSRGGNASDGGAVGIDDDDAELDIDDDDSE